MNNTQALKSVKELFTYGQANTITEIEVQEYEYTEPLTTTTTKMNRVVKVEYTVAKKETVVSSHSLDSKIQEIQSQIDSLATQKEEISTLKEIVADKESLPE